MSLPKPFRLLSKEIASQQMNTGSLAILAAIRRALSLVSSFVARGGDAPIPMDNLRLIAADVASGQLSGLPIPRHPLAARLLEATRGRPSDGLFRFPAPSVPHPRGAYVPFDFF